MINFSIVSIVNKEDVYTDFLNNVKRQNNINYELIKIDNTKGQFDSARIAYNSVINNAKGEYILFCHPDIRFLDDYCLSKIYLCISKIQDFGVVGIAGCSFNNNERIFSSIVHGISKKSVGQTIDSPRKMQTVDECFFIIKNSRVEVFSVNKGWHLYAVELCLDYVRQGKENYVVPANIWHISDGKSLDYKYFLQLRKICQENLNFKFINTTVGNWHNTFLFRNFIIYFYSVKQIIKRRLI